MEDNKDKLAQKRREKNICGCGSIFSHGSKSRHEKTDKHKTWVEANPKN